jgi:Family of unknown function (DUF6159)
MERISRGWRLAKQSLAVVRSDPALAGLVIVGGVLTALVALPAVAVALVVSEGDEPSGAAWVVLAVGGYVVYAITIFFGVALVRAAARVIDGEDATVGESIGFALERLRPILGWALVGSLVSLAFSLLRRSGLLGSILAGLGGAAWSLVTFLAVPVIAFEGLGPLETLKRSAALFRERWGEQITGSIGIGLIFFLLSLPAIALVVVGLALAATDAGLLGWLVVLAGVVAIGVVTVLGRAASATFGAVLYYYAVTGGAPPQFTEGDLRSVVQPA